MTVKSLNSLSLLRKMIESKSWKYPKSSTYVFVESWVCGAGKVLGIVASTVFHLICTDALWVGPASTFICGESEAQGDDRERKWRVQDCTAWGQASHLQHLHCYPWPADSASHFLCRSSDGKLHYDFIISLLRVKKSLILQMRGSTSCKCGKFSICWGWWTWTFISKVLWFSG